MNNLQNLSSQEYQAIFDDIIDGKLSDAQTQEFLLALNQINPDTITFPTNAFLGAIQSFKPRCKIINASQDVLDVCGTGGDGLNTLNISTAVALVVAACGVKVAKHGNRAVSSLSGSADVLSELGVDIMASSQEVERSLQENNLCFIFAPLHHPAFKNITKIRTEIAKKFGVPTIFNFLGPLLNPANSKYQLIGTSKSATMLPMLQALQASGSQRVFIVYGQDGMDEITISDNSLLLKLTDQKISDLEIINPENYHIKKSDLSQIKGGDAKYNARKIIELLNGEQSAYADIVILNSAFALMVAQKIQSIQEGVILAQEAIKSGKAKLVLKKIAAKFVWI